MLNKGAAAKGSSGQASCMRPALAAPKQHTVIAEPNKQQLSAAALSTKLNGLPAAPRCPHHESEQHHVVDDALNVVRRLLHLLCSSSPVCPAAMMWVGLAALPGDQVHLTLPGQAVVTGQGLAGARV